MRLPLTASLLLALLALAAPARAQDSAPPKMSHTPVTRAPSGPVKITAVVTDQSKFYPQLLWRTRGAPWTSIDMKKGAAKDTYEATLTLGSAPIEYYLECYDEMGNGPAQAGTADKPYTLEVEKAVAAAAPPVPSAAPPVPRTDPKPAVAAAPPPPPRAEAPPPPPPAHDDHARAEPTRAPAAAVATQAPPRASGPVGPGGALWRSAIGPGWGQFATDRPIRGSVFAGAAAISVITSAILIVRADDANKIYENCSVSCRQATYDQAVSYANARNAALVTTAVIWGVNALEAYLFHGSKD